MDNTIVEVAIGLVLIYAVLALLAMKLVETFNGSFTRGRTSVLHKLVFEAVGRDHDLRQKIFRNPLIFALSPGGEAARPSMLRPSGPSAIPPDLFARALLMELNGGTHPSDRFSKPQQFLDDTAKATGLSDRRKSLLQALAGLQVGAPAQDWPAFEAAIAKWFSDIGDRAEGWFKRRSDLWGWGIAFAVCAGLNVDTVHIARSLSNDDQLRGSIAAVAERVVRERDRDSAATVAPESTTIRNPETRATARLVDAIGRLREAYFRDNEIAKFGHNLLSTSKYCSVIAEVRPATRTPADPQSRSAARTEAAPQNFGQFVSNSNTWQHVLPSLLPLIDRAAQGITEDRPWETADGNGGTSPPSRTGVRPAASQAPTARMPEDLLNGAHLCMSHVSAWVRAAATASDKPEVRQLMQDAAVALEDSKSAVLHLMNSAQLTASIRTLFQRNPDNFKECVSDAGTTRFALESCLRRETSMFDRLPLFHSPANWRQQFCKVRVFATKRDAQQEELLASLRRGGNGSTLCEAQLVEEDKALRLPAMTLELAPWSWVPWLLGLAVSTAFVALGAPFWFGLLGRLVRIRAAGDVREAQDNRLKATGTLPLPPPTLGSRGSATTSPWPRPSPVSSPGAVEMAANRFEDQLTQREVIALQQAIDATASGKLDDETRLKLRSYTREHGLGETDTLTLATYTAVVRRPPLSANTTVDIAGTRPLRNKPYVLAQSLAQNLMLLLGFDGRIPSNEIRFSDDLRALAVLYRYKRDPTTQLQQREVFKLAKDLPAQLDTLDEALLNEILAARSSNPVLARDSAAPWMDWALGELGQVENNASTRDASNRRICEYLDTVGLGDKGDTTAWCGAFVNWVLIQHNTKDQPGTPQQVVDKAHAATAAKWIGWKRRSGQQVSRTTLQFGDVVVVKAEGKFHVAFFLCQELGPSNQDTVCLVGGNQADGSRVCLSRWPLSDVRNPDEL